MGQPFPTVVIQRFQQILRRQHHVGHRRLLTGPGRLERVDVLAQRAVLGDATKVVQVQGSPSGNQVTGEGIRRPGDVPVGVRVESADLGEARVVGWVEVLPEFPGHGIGLSIWRRNVRLWRQRLSR